VTEYPRRQGTALFWLTFVTFAALYAATAGARGYSVDGDFAYNLARDIVNRGPIVAFGAQRELLRRWAPGLPLLGTPFVAAGTAVARILPPANSVPLDGLPGASGTVIGGFADLGPISRDVTNGSGDATSLDFSLPLPDRGRVTAITVVSALAFAADLPDGTVVANVIVHGADGTVIGSPIPMRAGIETAEWRWGDPSRPPIAHRLASVAGTWDGNANAYWFRATLPLSDGSAIARGVRVEAVSRSGRLYVASVVASMPESVATLSPTKPGGAEATSDRITRAAFGLANVIPGAAIVALMVPVAGAFGAGARAALVLSVTTGLATLVWPYARLDFAETLAGAFALGAFATRLAAAQRDRSVPIAFALNVVAGALTLGAGMAKYTALWFAPLVAIDAIVRPGVLPRFRVAALFLVPGVAVGVLAFTSGTVAPRVITELPDGLARGWLSFPLWVGLLSLLASSGKGLLWHSPPIVLAVAGAIPFARTHGASVFLPFAASAIYLLVYGSKGNWHGGGWGPRYVVPMVPFAMLIALPIVNHAVGAARGAGRDVARVALAVLFVAGLGVNSLAVLKHPNAWTIMFRDHLAPQLEAYGAAHGGTLARAYVAYFRQAKASTELVRPPSMPADTGGTPLPLRGLGHLIDLDSPLIVRIWPTRPARFTLTLYFCNYDGPPDVPRYQNVTVVDVTSAQTVRVDDFGGGVYASWTVDTAPDNPIIIATYDSGRAFPIISGIFFDPAEHHVETQPGSDTGPIPSLDRTTSGAWVGRYGREGAVLPAYEMGPRDAGAMPPYIEKITGGLPVWVDTGELERSEAPLLYAPGFSPIVAHAWLLANDLVAAVFPVDLALRQRALASPPWRYIHGIEVHSPHPEYGLGIDLWPLAIRDWFASWPRVIAAAWVTHGLLIVTAVGGAVGIGRVWARAGGGLDAGRHGVPNAVPAGRRMDARQ
jgi:hypothetical protein